MAKVLKNVEGSLKRKGGLNITNLKKFQVSCVVVSIIAEVARRRKIRQQCRHACLDELQFLSNPYPSSAFKRTRDIVVGARIPS